MEAPENLYFQVCGDCYASKEDCRNCKFHDVEDSVTWSKKRIYDDDIEYTRTDSFIKKAKKCLVEWAGVYVSETTGEGVNKRKILANDLLNYFENHMKG